MTRQTDIPMAAFARAMRQRCRGFDQRVAKFELTFGPTDDALLAILAQAAYFCWFECEYERDFLEACRAIGLGRPTSQLLCQQVTPERWNAVNTYVVAVQRWRGCERAMPDSINLAKVERVCDWLGPDHPSKLPLADLFLHWLVRDLRLLSLSRLTGEPSARDLVYEDYSDWYRQADGSLYGQDVASAAADVRQRLLDPGQMPAGDVETLVKGITAKSQPACQHRYTRWQDIKLASIGALKWRGHVPPDDEAPKQEAARFLDAAAAAVRTWAQGQPPEGLLAERIQQALGPLSDHKRAIALDFFLAPKDGIGDSFFTWLAERSLHLGCRVGDGR